MAGGRYKCPVFLPVGTLFDPFTKELFFGSGQLTVGRWGGHTLANVGVCNTAKQLASLWLPGNHDGRPVSLPKQAHAAVESKIGGAVGRITSVTAEAGV